MELPPKSTAAKEQYLRVIQTKEPRTPSVVQRPAPSVPPVTLERRWLTMQADPTKAQSPATTTTTSASAATAAPTPAPLSALTRETTTTTTSSIPQPSPKSSSTTTVTAEGPAFQGKTATTTTSTTHAETAKASPVGATSSSSSTALPLLLLSPSPEESLVGKIRVTPPASEKSPVIILTQHQDETEAQPDETVSELQPGSDTRSTRRQLRRQEQTIPFLAPNPEEAKSQLSIQEPIRERGRELERTGGRPAGHSSAEVSPKRDVTDVMQFFQEQEKSLQASFLSLPKTGQRKQRSPSPKVQHAAGLQHLDNLIHLMEQLTSLKDENIRLRKRCDYLESTKVLLQAKRDLSFESSSSSSGFVTLQAKHKHHHHSHHHHHHHHQQQQQQQQYRQQLLETAQKTSDHEQKIVISRLQAEGSLRLSRPRISSAEELEFYEQADTSSDQRPKRPKTAMHKRSFSTGSLEVPSDFSPDTSGLDTRKRSKSKPGRSIFSKSTSSKQKTKGSKWARVKKVLTGQKLYEDLGTTIRSIRDLGRSTHHPRYAASDTPLDASPPLRVTIEDHRPTNGKATGDNVMRTSTTESYKSADTEDGDADLTSDIWMGPPDWWEEYEARKESGGSTNSDISSVIEVTTMYLGTRKDATAVPAMIASASPALSSENFLTVEKPLPRRQSSPSLSMKEGAEEDDVLDELTVTAGDSRRPLHKSSSCKSADLELPKSSDYSSDGRQSKKFHRTAWGRVKDIIHTRKDSIRKRPKRERPGVDSEEPSEADMEAIMEDQWRGEASGESKATSPVTVRQQNGKSEAVTTPPPGSQQKRAPPVRTSSYQGGPAEMAALLAGSLSDEFARKMQQWEAMRSKKSTSFRASMDESDLPSVEVSGTSQDYPIRTIDLRDLKGKVPDSSSEAATAEESNTSMEVHGAPTINVEEIQRRITDSFSRKMQDWERLKYKTPSAIAKDTSPEVERKATKSRKEDRQKSKRSREEKEKEKWERQRERDIQKVEREQQKLEKEKVRIEKERLRTMEREAKLERLKGRLSQSECDPSGKSPVLTSLAEYKVTADFARKLHEWELKKGLSHDVSNSIYMEAQKMSLKLSEEDREDQLSKDEQPISQRAEGGRKGVPPPPLTLQPYWDSPDDTSPIERLSEVSLGDDETCTSVTEECLTKSNIATLERANAQLLETLQLKEMEYTAVQDEVQRVKDKLSKVRDEHAAEMARFHHDLAQGNFSGPVKLEVGELESTMSDLEERIKVMENFGERLAMSMESAAVGKWQSIEGEETVHTQLVELVDQMRTMLIQASKSDEHSQKSMALSNFETLYSQAMKLQVQMNNLRLSHLERNREIMNIKRQLLLQEVNNLLLQADITRRETELYQFQEARKFASLKRWNTFSGTDRSRPHVMMEISPATPTRSVIDTPTRSVIDTPTRSVIDTPTRSFIDRESKGQPPESPRVNIPYMSEEVFRPSTYVGSHMSAPASPTTLAAAVPPPAAPSISAAGQRHSGTGASTRDQLQAYLVLPPSLRTLGASAKGAPSGRRADEGVEESPPSTSEWTAGQDPQRRPPPSTHRAPDSSKSADAARESISAAPRNGSRAAAATVAASVKPEFNTICDSAPLFREIEELKRVKGKVERGSPTLIRRKRDGPLPEPSPGTGPRATGNLEAPDPTIPQQRGLGPSQAGAAKLIIDDVLPDKPVMECTEEIFLEEERTQLNYDYTARGSSTEVRSLGASSASFDLPPASDPGKVARTKHKVLRRQKEETVLKDYKAISPKGSPIATRGKPPLPKQAAPAKPHAAAPTPAPDKSPRSKSLGDVERGTGASTDSKPLQEAINRFEKRATVCETEDRPIELRKTPSPTLHLPRVGLVTRVRRLKPAAELLEESQRYRSGSSIYATRIMPRYLQKDDVKGQDASAKASQNKENHSGTYVHAIVKRLSRESTPTSRSAASSRTNSELSLKRSDSPRTQSEFVSQIVRQLSSSGTSESHRGLAPFKDLTNEGVVKKLAQSFNGKPTKGSPERTLSDSDIDRQVSETPAATAAQHRKSCEVAMVMSSSMSPTSEASYQMVSSMSSDEGSLIVQPSTSTPINHQSLPTLAAPSSAAAEEASRSRAATYSVPEPEKPKASPEASSAKQPQPQTEEPAKKAAKPKSKSGKAEKKLESSRSPERRGASRGETVGVLCKQSISFDLGVSLYTQKPEGDAPGKSRQARSWDPSETIKAEVAAAAVAASSEPSGHCKSPRSSSPTVMGAEAMGEPTPGPSTYQGEVPPGSPTSEEKKKRRFLDAGWLQISKKFFKVSK